MGNKATLGATLGASNHSEKDRVETDFYATDPAVVELLLERETFHNKIWECACGNGAISEVLKAHSHDVCSTDVVDRGYGEGEFDFLLDDTLWEGDIITNPPYKLALPFVEQALESVGAKRKVAMFLRLHFLEGKKRYEFFKEHPPVRIYVCSSRRSCYRNGVQTDKKENAICFAWFVWVKGYKGNPEIHWLP